MTQLHPWRAYAERVVAGEADAPKYVIKQVRELIAIADGEDERYFLDTHRLEQIDALLHAFIMPSGLRAGWTIYDATVGYQWLFYVGVLCTMRKDAPTRRRYTTAILEICRKNFKTFTIAVALLLLMFLEPRFAKFYSVAPDGSLSRLVRDAISEIIKASPYLGGDHERGIPPKFKVQRDKIVCTYTDITYTPLNFSTSRLDGRQPSAFLADEAGALPTSYPIEAMRSGQMGIENKLGCIVSTKYPTIDNPFETEVQHAKEILDGLHPETDDVFALLYEPDTTDWETNDLVLRQANPAALEIPEIMDDILRKRQHAIDVPAARENFVTKHCNIIYQGIGTESFIDIGLVRSCAVDEIDLAGRDVYLGMDLSMSNDNTGVAAVAWDGERVLCETMCFIPEAKIREKSRIEHVDYTEFTRRGWCTPCGDMVVDYGVIEAYAIAFEETYGCTVRGVAYDRYNAMSTAQKLEAAGYPTIEVKQHSSVLHPATKRLSELIESGNFAYRHNQLLEINFQNARCRYDTNLNRYVDKKRSRGRVDLVVAIINAMYLIEQNEMLDGGGNWGAQY